MLLVPNDQDTTPLQLARGMAGTEEVAAALAKLVEDHRSDGESEDAMVREGISLRPLNYVLALVNQVCFAGP